MYGLWTRNLYDKIIYAYILGISKADSFFLAYYLLIRYNKENGKRVTKWQSI